MVWTLFLTSFIGMTSFGTFALADDHMLTAAKLFDPHHVVDIEISVPEADWDTIRAESRSIVDALKKEPAESPFTYVKADISIDGVDIKDVGIRKKGFLGSLDEQRPSLKVKFAEYKDQSPIAGLDRLTLNNNKQDPSGLSQYLGYRIFNESGTVASRCNLAHLTVNGKDLGIYSNVESIKPPMLEHGFGDNSGALWEGTITDFYEEFIKRFEKKNEQAKYEPLRQVADILAQEAVDVDRLGKLVDIEAFVRFWATESLIGFWDGYTNNQNNFFIYQDPANSKLYFIPWGADALFSENMPLPPFTIRPRFVHSRSLMANRLYRVPTIQKLYHQTLMELLEKHWNETELLAEVDRVEAMLKDLVRDENPQFLGSVAKVRTFIKTRREKLMKEMEDGPAELKSLAKLPVYARKVGTMTASFTTRWYDKTPQNPKDMGEVEIELTVDGKRIEFSKIGVYAGYSRWLPLTAGTPKPPTIVFIGQRKSNGKDLILGIGMSSESFQPSNGKPVDIGGVLMEGPLGFLFPTMRVMAGKVILESADTKDGAVIRGMLELTVLRMIDGS